MKHIAIAVLTFGFLISLSFAGTDRPVAFDPQSGETYTLDQLRAGRSVDYDVAPMLDIPYPTTFGVPVFGQVELTNLGDMMAGGVDAQWSLDGSSYSLQPVGPYNLNVGQTRLLYIWDPNHPEYEDFWMPEQEDIGQHELNAVSSFDLDENPDNDEFPVVIDVQPMGKFEVGVDSRSFNGMMTVPEPGDGPVVRINPDEVNPEFFLGSSYDIADIRMRVYFSNQDGGASPDASITFHVFEGGNVPGEEIYTGVYTFDDVDPGYVGEYDVVMDVSDALSLNWLYGDVWIWAEIGTAGDNLDDIIVVSPSPYVCQTRPNDMQSNQYLSPADAQAGTPLTEFGHHLTCTVNHLTQGVPVTLDLAPIQTEIGTWGGSIFYSLDLETQVNYNLADLMYWVDITGPEGYLVEQYRTAVFNMWPGRHMIINSIENAVPGWAPAGTYHFQGYVGYYPNVMAADGFDFVKTGEPEGDGAAAWQHDELVFSADELAADPNLPDEYEVSQAYPNPFNPTTTLAVNLPQGAELEAAVYNVSGRLVETIAKGQFEAGQHELTVDGSNMASGVYFVRVNVPGQLNEMRKIVLMK